MKPTKEEVAAMIDRFVGELGLKKEEVFNPERNAWYWTKGSAKIEVFIHEIKFETTSRYYLRIFSPMMSVPSSNREAFYRKLLEMNDAKLCVKMTVMPGTDQVYATYERDINGLDYEELSTCIYDLEWWADSLDDELKQQFSGEIAPRE